VTGHPLTEHKHHADQSSPRHPPTTARPRHDFPVSNHPARVRTGAQPATSGAEHTPRPAKTIRPGYARAAERIVASAESGPKWPGLSTVQSLGVASQFGVTLAVGVGLGLLAGQWLDSLIHSGIVLTLIGALAGLVVGITSTVASIERCCGQARWSGATRKRRSLACSRIAEEDSTTNKRKTRSIGAARRGAARC
jgi:Putative F0F1-ATPase subunit Ca2+/Mg2+ transporter